MKRVILLSCMMLMLGSACGGGQVVDVAEMLQEWEAGLRSRDLEKTMANYGDDIVWEDAATGDRATGKEELRSMVVWLFSIPDVKWDVTSSFVSRDGKWAANEWVWTGSYGGQDFSISGASILEIREGKIVRETIYYDKTSSPF